LLVVEDIVYMYILAN